MVAIQVITGARRMWLPGWLRRRSLPSPVVITAIERSLPWLAWCEQALAPRRLMALSGKIARPILGLAVLAMALVIVLPIPFGNIVPVIAIGLLALAILERDGIAVIAALAMTVLGLVWTAILFAFGAQVLATAGEWWTRVF